MTCVGLLEDRKRDFKGRYTVKLGDGLKNRRRMEKKAAANQLNSLNWPELGIMGVTQLSLSAKGFISPQHVNSAPSPSSRLPPQSLSRLLMGHDRFGACSSYPI